MATKKFKALKLFPNKNSRRLLILLMTAHIFGTSLAYSIFIKLSSLGDGYAPDDFHGFTRGFQDLTSTELVHSIYHYLGNILPGVLTPMALGLVVAIVTWHAFRDVYTQINRNLFWVCNLFPLFLIWSGSSSKEQITIIFGIIVISFVAKFSFTAYRLNIISLVFVILSLWFIFKIRPNCFLIYLTIFITSFIAPTLNKMKIYKLSIGIWTFTFFVITSITIICTFLFTKNFSTIMIDWMATVEAGFLGYDGGSNRYDIEWNDINDFLYNSLWGIPQGFIGPTLNEAIAKPLQLPVFFEGIVYLFILCYLFLRILHLSDICNMLRVHILPYFFVALLIVYLSYPYLIFNAGSALRYKQAMHPILIFYPLLILAYARANNLIYNKKKFVEKIKKE